MLPPSTPDHAVPPAAPAPTLRQRLRVLRLRARRRGRVELQGRPLLGRRVRFEIAPGARVILGEGARIGDRCRLNVHSGTVTIGDRAVLGDGCVIAARAGVRIGERCLLGEEVAIIDFDHRIDEVETPMRLQGLIANPVEIGAGAVLGARAAILRGVRVGDGALIGAHSVVTRDVPAGAEVSGTPARTAEQRRAARRRAGGRGGPRG